MAADWIVELGIGAGRPPIQVHVGDSHMAGNWRRQVHRNVARRLLADSLRACSHCRPEARLDILDLAAGVISAQLERPSDNTR